MPVGPCLSEDQVARWLEGRLAGAELQSAEAHLASCEACLRIVADAGAALETKDGARDDATTDGPLVPGVAVGRYVVVAPVGAGGMGRVYEATDPALDRRVALKLLHRDVTDPSLEARLLREAKTMARLDHPEVVAVYDVGRYGDRLFVAMEFVEGGTLRDWLAAAPRGWREVLGVFERAGRGLASAHASGVVHRDFKPDNVLVGRDGRVRVTDFGLAATAGAAPGDARPDGAGTSGTLDAGAPLTRTGALLGTPAYMAPEQLEGRGVDARSDAYAFCVALWEALYGERPFRAPTLGDLALQKEIGEPLAPPERGVPERVKRALLVGLRPVPDERYPSMDALLAALARAARPPIATPLAWTGTVLVAVAAAALLGARARARVAAAEAPPSGAAPACASDAACVASHGGAPWVCRASDGACVAVASEDCAPLADPSDLAARDLVWLGVLFPTSGAGADDGRMNLHGADLARSEIAAATRALAGEGASLPVPRVGLVACDDGVDAARAARHLVDDVGVPAILGFRSGKEVIDLAGSFLIQRRVLTMATITQSAAITRLPQPTDLPRMVWRTSNNFDAAATATAAFVRGVLGPRAGARALRVALVRDDEATSLLPFAETFYRALVPNGRPGVDGSPAYDEVTLAPDPDTLAKAARRLAAAAPAVVVRIGSRDRTVPFVAGVEAAWTGRARRPAYVVADDTTEVLHDLLAASPENRRRVFSVSPVAMPGTTNRFLMRFEMAHPGEANPTLNPSSTYDGVYALAYAVFATRARPVTGPDLARGLARLAGPGKRIETGPTALFEGIAALGRGEPVDLEGASGRLDFDAATGELTDDFSLLCPGVDALGRPAGDVESGVVYAASTGQVRGTLACR